MGKAGAKKKDAAKAPAAEDEEEEDEGPSGKGKKDAKKKGKPVDAFAQMELERRREARQRIVERFLRLILVGFILDALKGKSESSSGKEVDRKKKGPNSGKGQKDGSEGMSVKSIKEKANTYGGPAVMVAFIVAMLAIRAAEEGYHPADQDEHGFNFYEVMGLSRGVDQMEIRKAYKALALKYHPDKNPDCVECAEIFGKISKAYDTLSNPEARKAYDSGRRAKKTLESQSSVELTVEDFETQVLRSNEVWFVQAYDPNDGTCKSFATGWEDVAHTYGDHARFGRLDVTKKELKSLLPFKPVLLPVVFRYARGMSVEHWMYSDRFGRDEEGAGGGKALTNFMDSTFPEFHRYDTAAELKKWWNTDEPRILVVGPSSSSRAAKAVDFMPVLRLAHVWEEFFSFASADAQLVTEVLGSEFALDRGQTWALMLRSPSGVSRTQVRNVRDMAPLIQDFISEQIPRQAPVGTVRNFQQLCGDRVLGQGTSRTYCLILTDTGADQTAKALRELESSQKAYYQEVQEIKNAGEDAEEPFRIQPIRIASSGSRFPWSPAGPGQSFWPVWKEASKAWAFILDVETRKFAAVKTASLNELYQGIAYEDLPLSELNEDGPPLSRLASDPETTLRREVSAILSTSLGACFAYLLVAIVVAISPELELPALTAGLTAMASVATLASPVLTRHFIGIFWCTINASRMECQRNS
mmetsp:Transcript_38909/g.90084  ORF Transcript_38909/g.90084 Transcript_38909/m.90084 type:complete len:699 (-) Transcript_38909:193-2289(-)